MSNDKTGGSAFPMADAPFAYQDGMTLRDYFAGQWICGNLRFQGRCVCGGVPLCRRHDCRARKGG